MYKLLYKTDQNDTVQEVHYNSLYALTQQVISDFNTNVLCNIDHLVSVTYESNKQEKSALITVLSAMKYRVSAEIKDQLVYKLKYLKEGL